MWIRLYLDKLLPKIKGFFLKYEQKMVLIAAFCLVSAVSYEFGVLQGQKWQQKPLLIEKPADIPAGQANAQDEASKAPASVSEAVLPASPARLAESKRAGGPSAKAACAYVGSKSSNKFYLSSCQWAKSIKPENLVCFQSAEQAVSQGRTESRCTK